MRVPRITSYGPYGGNYGVHCLGVEFLGVDVWKSYDTVVAFHFPNHGRVVHENDWGPTTGKHLNAIDGGQRYSSRVDDETFQRPWKEQGEEYVRSPGLFFHHLHGGSERYEDLLAREVWNCFQGRAPRQLLDGLLALYATGDVTRFAALLRGD